MSTSVLDRGTILETMFLTYCVGPTPLRALFYVIPGEKYYFLRTKYKGIF